MASSNSNSNPGSKPLTHSTGTSFMIPGSADAHVFMSQNPEVALKFKSFLEGFYLADNAWHQAYEGIKTIPRPGFNTVGKEAIVAINSHKVLKFPTQTIYQYDVSYL